MAHSKLEDDGAEKKSGGRQGGLRRGLACCVAAFVLVGIAVFVVQDGDDEDESSVAGVGYTASGGKVAGLRQRTCFVKKPQLSLHYAAYWNDSSTGSSCSSSRVLCAGDANMCSAGSLPSCTDICAVSSTGTLEVVVVGVLGDNRGGLVRVGLASSASQWNRGQPKWKDDAKLSQLTAAPQAGQMRFSFRDVPFGVIAFAVLHDENKDGEMETTFYGKPEEGMASSRNASGGLSGGPKFSTAAFMHAAPVTRKSAKMWYP